MGGSREEKYYPCEDCKRDLQLQEAALVRTNRPAREGKRRTPTVVCPDCIERYYSEGECEEAGQRTLDPTMKNHPMKEYTVTLHTRIIEHRSHTVTVKARDDWDAAKKADRLTLIDEGTVVHRQQLDDPRRSIRSIKEVK